MPAGCRHLGLVAMGHERLLASLVSPTQRRPKLGFTLGGSDSKEYACNAGDGGLIPVLGRSPGKGNGNPLQYSCWEIPWTEEPGGPVCGVTTQSDTIEHVTVSRSMLQMALFILMAE